MFERLEALAKRYDDLEGQLAREGAAKNPREYARLAKERADLEELVARFREWQRLQREAADAEKLSQDPMETSASSAGRSLRRSRRASSLCSTSCAR